MKKYFILIIVLIVISAIFYYSAPKTPEVQGITVFSPNGGESWSKGQKVQISWSAAKEIKSVDIRMAISGSEEGQNFNAAVASGVPNTGNYEWVVQYLYAEVWGINDLPLSDKYVVIVEDSEHSNIYDASDAVFSVK